MEKYKKINAADLHYLKASDMHPADTYFHFSFANYYDPNNMNFGVLRVINDDNVKPNSGFGTHPHQNMEIFSYVIDGQLTHRDSAGNHEVLGRGHVQCISAGNGVTHSELNEQNDWCRFLQIWIYQRQKIYLLDMISINFLSKTETINYYKLYPAQKTKTLPRFIFVKI